MEKQYTALGNINGLQQAGQWEMTTAPAPAPQSPFERLEHAVQRYRDLQQFANALAERIAGMAPPKDAAKTVDQGMGFCLIDGMEQQISFMYSIAQDINDSLNRIQNRL